ncbi:MAG: DUF2339 domain-containing protein [Proteobacteria bacterium]|nr:DUF2339 domain-containing protein [Pseudomonadota bacterium]
MEALVVVALIISVGFLFVFFGLVSALLSLSGLKKRVQVLENAVRLQRFALMQHEVAHGEAKPEAPPQETPPPAPPPPEMQPLGFSHSTGLEAAPKAIAKNIAEMPKAANSATSEAIPPTMSEPVPETAPPPPPPPQAPPHILQQETPLAPPAASAVEKSFWSIKRWFTEGNVPVKIGTLVLLAGVAALLKYAVDQEWLSFPRELRLASVALLALGGLVFAWKKRKSHRVFALSLQGGAIGVLLLTIFAAYKWYEMLPAVAAFALSIALIAGAGVLAVVQNAKALAVFAILAGFMAPIWLSTGSNNHVALFSYYAVLNAAILGIAWQRSWRVLNLLGFAFTFGIGTTWGVLSYSPEKFASSQFFLVLFFLFYLLLPILYARKRAVGSRDILDGSLLFGTPLIVFILQAGLLEFEKLPSAFCALGLSALYVVLAAAFAKRKNFVALREVYATLSLGFATLAIPLALSAKSTASIFALEGAGLIALGLRRKRWLPQWTGAGLQLLAGFAFFSGEASGLGGGRGEVAIFANPLFMSALLVALSAFVSAGCFYKAKRAKLATLFYAWGLAWWCGNGIHEISTFLPSFHQAEALWVFAVLTGWLAAEAYRRWPAVVLGLSVLFAFVGVAPLLFWQVDVHGHPWGGYGWGAWGVFAALGFRSLVCLKGGALRIAAYTQTLWWLLWATALSLWLKWLGVEFGLGEGWGVAGLALPWLCIFVLSLFRWPWLAFPQRESFNGFRFVFQSLVWVVLALWWLYALSLSAGSRPLPWLPLLNPLELTQLALLLATALWLKRNRSGGTGFLLPMLGFLFTSVVVLRASYHWGGFYYYDTLWSPAFLSDELTQTSLTVVWSILGVWGWVAGSRKGLWKLWLVGAVLMAVVLVKLVLVDRTSLGNILGILSFIAYGILCMVTGYFAPVPPRRPQGKGKEEEEKRT